jgi:hypothetical protein
MQDKGEEDGLSVRCYVKHSLVAGVDLRSQREGPSSMFARLDNGVNDIARVLRKPRALWIQCRQY